MPRPLPGPIVLGRLSREGKSCTNSTWARSRAPHLAAAAGELRELARIGITLIELIRLPSSRTLRWGYDGVDLFAPSHLYGRPDDFGGSSMRRMPGLGVILDVVYNHFGPSGNYLRAFAPAFFTDEYNEWATRSNFDGSDAGPVREFFVANAGYWIDAFSSRRPAAGRDAVDSRPI